LTRCDATLYIFSTWVYLTERALLHAHEMLSEVIGV